MFACFATMGEGGERKDEVTGDRGKNGLTFVRLAHVDKACLVWRGGRRVESSRVTAPSINGTELGGIVNIMFCQEFCIVRVRGFDSAQ